MGGPPLDPMGGALLALFETPLTTESSPFSGNTVDMISLRLWPFSVGGLSKLTVSSAMKKLY